LNTRNPSFLILVFIVASCAFLFPAYGASATHPHLIIGVSIIISVIVTTSMFTTAAFGLMFVLLKLLKIAIEFKRINILLISRTSKKTKLLALKSSPIQQKRR
jgi:uncharacterized metal-binding protein